MCVCVCVCVCLCGKLIPLCVADDVRDLTQSSHQVIVTCEKFGKFLDIFGPISRLDEVPSLFVKKKHAYYPFLHSSLKTYASQGMDLQFFLLLFENVC